MKKKRMPVFLSILFIIFAAAAVTFASFYVQPCGISEVIEIFKRSGYLIPLLNFLPVLLLMLLLFFITGSASAASASAGIAVVLLSFVNRYKIILRGDPFFFYDFSLAPEMFGVIKSFGARFIVIVAAACVLCVAAAVVFARAVRTKKMPYTLRIAGASAVLAAILLLNATVYKNRELYFDLPVIGNMYNDKDIFISKGFIYCFVYTFNAINVERPEGYDRNAALRFIENYAADAPVEKPKPNIIVIMSEAFSEISENPHFDFDGYVDPLENYKRVKEDSLAGMIVAPNFGGGTGDTEFDFLTAMNSRFLRGAPFVYRLIKHDVDALPVWLKNIGYRAEAFHPGHGWFYNRQNVYGFMGFDSFLHLKDLEDVKLSRAGYVTEESCFDKMIELYENRRPDTPLFLFTVTIEAHGPYDTYYGTPTNFNTDVALSAADTNAVSDYFVRLINADAQLARITDYLREDPAPAVLVFFGDHYPAFYQSAINALYGDLNSGVPRDRLALYTLPFLIWANDAAREQTEIYNNADKYFGGGPPVVSSSYLAPMLMGLLGYEDIAPAVAFVNSLIAEYPVSLENEYMDADFIPHPLNGSAEMIMYRNWTYLTAVDGR